MRIVEELMEIWLNEVCDKEYVSGLNVRDRSVKTLNLEVEYMFQLKAYVNT